MAADSREYTVFRKYSFDSFKDSTYLGSLVGQLTDSQVCLNCSLTLMMSLCLVSRSGREHRAFTEMLILGDS